ncbi:MAG: ribulose-phosphate 3-epimerase [Propionibacteriaceae bacterium]|nr:ribulose-phosphate 3-epimerase [Propionibacteriaceae bacterium]
MINTSVLNADLANLAAEVAKIPSSDGVHLDVADNHFVPNLTFGLPVVESLRKHVALPMDIHLMISNVDSWAVSYAEIGCESVTFHVEASNAPIRLARQLRAAGAKAAMALKPATSIEPYAELLPELDMILLMTVEPGFGGQAFLDLCLPKIRRTRELAKARGIEIAIQVDGGINEETIARAADAGADTFVAGSSVFSAANPDQMLQSLRALVP